jgi:hypothetical protein
MRGWGSEAAELRVATDAAERPGRYFCTDSDDALHHLPEGGAK